MEIKEPTATTDTLKTLLELLASTNSRVAHGSVLQGVGPFMDSNQSYYQWQRFQQQQDAQAIQQMQQEMAAQSIRQQEAQSQAVRQQEAQAQAFQQQMLQMQQQLQMQQVQYQTQLQTMSTQHESQMQKQITLSKSNEASSKADVEANKKLEQVVSDLHEKADAMLRFLKARPALQMTPNEGK